MTTLATVVRRVTFDDINISSVITYYVEFAKEVPPSVIDSVMKDLVRLGYKNVKARLVVT